MAKKDFTAQFNNVPKSMVVKAIPMDIDDESSIGIITAEINMYKSQTVQNIIEIGKRLREAKQMLPHGEYLNWLTNAVDFSERTASNFMRIAEKYPNRQAIADLPYTKMIALLQVPDDECEELISQEHIVAGVSKTVSDMSTRELNAIIKSKKMPKPKLQPQSMKTAQPIIEKPKNAQVTMAYHAEQFEIAVRVAVDNAICVANDTSISDDDIQSFIQTCIDIILELSDKLAELQK